MTKMDEQPKEPEEKTDGSVVNKPFILLEQDGQGGWDIKSNLNNPERHLRLIGATLVLRTEQ